MQDYKELYCMPDRQYRGGEGRVWLAWEERVWEGMVGPGEGMVS